MCPPARCSVHSPRGPARSRGFRGTPPGAKHRITDFLDDVGAPRADRERLVEALAQTEYHSGKLDKKTLAETVQDVFDPNREGRVWGSSLMPVTAESFVHLMETRALGMALAKKPARVESLKDAWHYCRFGVQSYAASWEAIITGSVRPQDAQMWEEPTWDLLVNRACAQVVLVLGGLSRHARREPSKQEGNSQQC